MNESYDFDWVRTIINEMHSEKPDDEKKDILRKAEIKFKSLLGPEKSDIFLFLLGHYDG